MRPGGEQAGAYVAHDIGGEPVQVMPADLAAPVRFGVDGLVGPSLCGEEDADAGLAVGVGVVAQVANSRSAGSMVTPTPRGLRGRLLPEGLAVVQASSGHRP